MNYTNITLIALGILGILLHNLVEPAAQTAQETKPRGTYAQFKMAQLALNGAGPMQAAQICDTFGVPKRTA